jgi:hypothetical protein
MIPIVYHTTVFWCRSEVIELNLDAPHAGGFKKRRKREVRGRSRQRCLSRLLWLSLLGAVLRGICKFDASCAPAMRHYSGLPERSRGGVERHSSAVPHLHKKMRRERHFRRSATYKHVLRHLWLSFTCYSFRQGSSSTHLNVMVPRGSPHFTQLECRREMLLRSKQDFSS